MTIVSEKPTINQMIAILRDQPFGVSLDISRNIKTLTRRYQNEGFSFLSKTLPQLCKALDRALSGNEAFSLPCNFKKLHKTCIPHFLGSALRRIFNLDGTLVEEPCHLTIRWLRTFTLYAYKIEVPFDENQIAEFEENFKKVDIEVGNIPTIGNRDFETITRLMEVQLRGLNVPLDVPSFGPGISANCKREDKYNVFVPPSPLRRHFGRDFFHLSNEHHLYEVFVTFIWSFAYEFLKVDLPMESDFSPSKVLFVPKDSRGPRVICCEDSRLMYAQKSLQKSLYRQVENHERFAGRVNFTDQTINQRLTFNPGYATLDLKEASDRVSLDVVISVFPQKLLGDMLACRSPYYELPSGEIHVMEKFAPMGSALCFPVMALIAYTAVTSQIYLDGGVVPNRNNQVFVYGDDIIVPNEWAESAIRGLTTVGLLVNEGKSFINSRFRESCGQDTFDQHSVTPLRKRSLDQPLGTRRENGRRVFVDSTGSLSNTVYLLNRSLELGFKNLYSELESTLEEFYKLDIPYGNESSPYLCKVVEDHLIYPYNQAHGHEVRGGLRCLVIRDAKRLVSYTSDYSRLRRQLLESDGIKPIDIRSIGARSPFLQRRTLRKIGTSYG